MQTLGPYSAAHLGVRVSAYVDGALEDSERESAQAHVADCDDCAAQVRRQLHLKQRMSGIGMPCPPASLVAALADRARVEEHVERVDRRRRVLVHAAVTVGSLCASLTVVGLVAGGSAPAAPRSPSAPVVASTPRVASSPVPAMVRSIGVQVVAAVYGGRQTPTASNRDPGGGSSSTPAPVRQDRPGR